MKKSLMLLVVAVMIVGVMAGCRESSESSGEAGDLQVSLAIEPDPPAVGEATLLITVEDKDGNPVNDADVSVKGDMNHAGMVPVLGDAEGDAEDGVYHVPFAWSMGGDWIITVTVALDDDNMTEREFEITGVVSSDEMDIGDMESTEEPMDMEATEESVNGNGISMGAPLIGTPEDCNTDTESTEEEEDCAVDTGDNGLSFP